MSEAQFAFFEGRIVPIDQARVSIMNHTFNYGTGCFEGIRAYWNEDEEQLLLFRLEEHYQRLKHSAGYLEIDLPYSVQDLCGITLDLLRQAGSRSDTYVRPLMYKSSNVIGCRLHALDAAFALFAVPFGRYVENEEAVHTGVSSWRRNPDSSIPARGKIGGAYVNSALSKTWAHKHGYDEAIVLNQDGNVAEGSAENLFMVRHSRLITPPLTEDILEGITRDTIIQLANHDLGLEVQERPIDRSELYVADELFLCGTGAQVAAVVSVDQRPVGTGVMGAVTASVRDLYFDVVRGKVAPYRTWCTPVYVPS